MRAHRHATFRGPTPSQWSTKHRTQRSACGDFGASAERADTAELERGNTCSPVAVTKGVLLLALIAGNSTCAHDRRVQQNAKVSFVRFLEDFYAVPDSPPSTRRIRLTAAHSVGPLRGGKPVARPVLWVLPPVGLSHPPISGVMRDATVVIHALLPTLGALEHLAPAKVKLSLARAAWSTSPQPEDLHLKPIQQPRRPRRHRCAAGLHVDPPFRRHATHRRAS